MRHQSPRPRFQRVARVRFRRVVRRLDRAAPALLIWVPSWGTSLLLHGAALLLLALYLYARSAGRDPGEIRAALAPQLTDDVTSLVKSDHAGDPFTTLKSPEPPSLSIEPPAADTTAISQPMLASLARFAPDLAGPDLPDGPDLGVVTESDVGKGVGTGPASAKGKGPKYRIHSEDVTAPFSGRGEMTRAQLVRREGGTVRSEKAVEEGLAWLARHQREDGGWSLNFQSQCKGSMCPVQMTLETDTAATGLALLPMLGAGHIHTAKSRYQGVVRRGVDWLVGHQQEDGSLFVGGDHQTPLYSHAIATMALCEAFGLSGDPLLREPAQRAINFIVKAQNTDDGGWRYFPGQAGDTSVFGWQMFALRSARLAGLKLSKNVIAGCKAYLDAASVDRKITYAYMPGRPATTTMTAEALLSRQYLGWPRDFPPLVKGASHIAADLLDSNQRNIYYWYYATQLLHNMQNRDWQRWNVRVREALIAMQVKGDGCDRGSWDPFVPQPDIWAQKAGRLFLTSLSLLTLEVYYRYLPLYRPADTDPSPMEAVPATDERKAAAKPDPTPLKDDPTKG